MAAAFSGCTQSAHVVSAELADANYPLTSVTSIQRVFLGSAQFLYSVTPYWRLILGISAGSANVFPLSSTFLLPFPVATVLS